MKLTHNYGQSEELEPIQLPVSEKVIKHISLLLNQKALCCTLADSKKATMDIAATLALFRPLSYYHTQHDPTVPGNIEVAIFPENPNVLGFKDLENSSPDYHTT